MGNTPFKDDWFRQGNMQALTKWLEVNDVNKQNEFGNTVGHWACWHNQPQMLKLSIEKGLFVNVANNGVNTPLHLAAYRKSIKCVQFLLECNDCNVSVVNASGYTARDIAERKKSDEIVRLIDEYKSTNPGSEEGGEGATSPGAMTTSPSADSVTSESSGVEEESKDEPPKNASRIFQMLRELLPAGVPDTVVQGEVDKLAAEMIVEPNQLADFGKADLQGMGLKAAVVAKLLQWEAWEKSKKADEPAPAAKVKKSRSLFGSFRKGKKKTFKPWKEHWFERGQHKKFERWVKKYGKNINWQNVHGNTAAHWAAWNKQLPMLVLCAEHGADFAMKNNGDNTPLHLAAYRNAVSCVQFLLARNAPWDVQNQTKETPRDVAQRMNYTSVCRFIDMHTGAPLQMDGEEDMPEAGTVMQDGPGVPPVDEETPEAKGADEESENKQARLVQIQSLYLELDDGSKSEMSEMSEYSISEAPDQEEEPPVLRQDDDEGPAPVPSIPDDDELPPSIPADDAAADGPPPVPQDDDGDAPSIPPPLPED